MRVFLGKDIRTDNRATQKLRREVEKAKRALSAAHQTRVEIESFFDGEVCNIFVNMYIQTKVYLTGTCSFPITDSIYSRGKY